MLLLPSSHMPTAAPPTEGRLSCFISSVSFCFAGFRVFRFHPQVPAGFRADAHSIRTFTTSFLQLSASSGAMPGAWASSGRKTANSPGSRVKPMRRPTRQG